MKALSVAQKRFLVSNNATLVTFDGSVLVALHTVEWLTVKTGECRSVETISRIDRRGFSTH